EQGAGGSNPLTPTIRTARLAYPPASARGRGGRPVRAARRRLDRRRRSRGEFQARGDAPFGTHGLFPEAADHRTRRLAGRAAATARAAPCPARRRAAARGQRTPNAAVRVLRRARTGKRSGAARRPRLLLERARRPGGTPPLIARPRSLCLPGSRVLIQLACKLPPGRSPHPLRDPCRRRA